MGAEKLHRRADHRNLAEADHRREERCDLLPHQQPERHHLRLNEGW